MFKKIIAVAVIPLALSSCVSSSSTPVLMSPSCPVTSDTIGYNDSKIGINYRGLTTSPMAEILSLGEAEYLSSVDEYGQLASDFTRNDVVPTWRKQIKVLLSEQQLPVYTDERKNPSIYLFQLYTPTMFQRLRTCISPDDPQLGYITRLPRYPATQTVNH